MILFDTPWLVAAFALCYALSLWQKIKPPGKYVLPVLSAAGMTACVIAGALLGVPLEELLAAALVYALIELVFLDGRGKS